jgi:hypothetical protein
MPSDIAREQDALITYEVIRWFAATCPDHVVFVDECTACQLVPQTCPAHPKVNGSFPGFDLGCEACMATRPGFETVKVVGSEVVSAEEAVRKLGIPHIRLSGGMLRVPLNLLRRPRGPRG